MQVVKGWEDWFWIVIDEIIEFDFLLLVIQDFDWLEFGVFLCVMYEVFGGIWEVLVEGCGDLVVGVINELLVGLGVQWCELGEMYWVYVVVLCYLLVKVRVLLMVEQMQVYCVVVVVDMLCCGEGCVYGYGVGQVMFVVFSMVVKIEVQCVGLGVGWLFEVCVVLLLVCGEFVVKVVVVLCELNWFYVGWCGGDGWVLVWWLDKLDEL